ncbi:MAG: ketoacyl-ACP synthase III [Spirochaetaceae bacterium]|jgi:3-oxoacyl-[acyl-carrier-protein] synthase-3|nr:ketoacyl-ACP synthase III [Spirochaetaceae bacterium]
MAIEIIATGRATPPRRISNAELAEKISTSDEWIRSHTGIGSRYIADEQTATSDLALQAAINTLSLALERKTVQEHSLEELALTLDMIIIGTVSPDYYGFPSTACLVQHGLGALNAGAMDISAACSGFVYGLETASGLLCMRQSRKRALVMGAEVLSRLVDWDDRGTCILFGDGAGAALIEKRPDGKEKRGLLQTVLRADGSGAQSLVIQRGGSRNPYRRGEIIDTPPHVQMDGRAVYNFAVKAVTEIVDKLLALEGIGIDAVKWIVPHQANARIVAAAGKRLGIPAEKFFLNIESYANTSAASIPIALDELNRREEIRTGDIIMTIGFGGGLTYGGNLIKW